MRSLFYIFFLVLIAAATGANAESGRTGIDNKDLDEKKAKKVEKVLALLKKLDIQHQYITDTAEYIAERSNGGYIYLADEEMFDTGIQVQIRYDTGGFDKENLQLNFTEKGSNYNLTGSAEGVMLKYRVTW